MICISKSNPILSQLHSDCKPISIPHHCRGYCRPIIIIHVSHPIKSCGFHMLVSNSYVTTKCEKNLNLNY